MVDKVKIYFVKDSQLFYKFRDGGASKSEGSYNDVINMKLGLILDLESILIRGNLFGNIYCNSLLYNLLTFTH